MGKFKTGDKVRVKNVAVHTCSNLYTFVDGMSKYIGKEFTIKYDYGNGDYMLDGIPYFWSEDWLESVMPETIVIYRNGDKTIARNKRTGEEAEAKCSKDDEYDFYTGAKIAFNRLAGEDKAKEEPMPKLYNGKVVCIKPASSPSLLTRGKIYEFKDGYSKYDSGDRMPFYHDAVISFEDLRKKVDEEFVELVED